MSITEIKTLLQNAGVVGAGGAGFPTYAKLADAADVLCINAAECEPLIYTDLTICREEMAKVATSSNS